MGVMVVVVVAILVVLLLVLVLRRRRQKQLHAVNTEERVVDNPVYAGTPARYMLYSGIRFPYQHCCSFLLSIALPALSPYTLPAGNNYHYATVSVKLEPVSNNVYTLEPNTSSLENQPHYEVPVPQQQSINTNMHTTEESRVSETV